MKRNPISKRSHRPAALTAAQRELEEHLPLLACAFRSIDAAVQAAPDELRAQLYSAGGLLRPIAYDA